MDPPHRPPFFWKNGLHFFKKMNPPQHPPFFQKNNGRSRPYFHCHRPLHVEQIFLEKKWALWGRFCSKGVGRLPPSVFLRGKAGAWAPALPAANLPGCKLRCLWGWPPAGSLLAAPVRRAQPLVAAGCTNVPVGAHSAASQKGGPVRQQGPGRVQGRAWAVQRYALLPVVWGWAEWWLWVVGAPLAELRCFARWRVCWPMVGACRLYKKLQKCPSPAYPRPADTSKLP